MFRIWYWNIRTRRFEVDFGSENFVFPWRIIFELPQTEVECWRTYSAVIKSRANHKICNHQQSTKDINCTRRHVSQWMEVSYLGHRFILASHQLKAIEKVLFHVIQFHSLPKLIMCDFGIASNKNFILKSQEKKLNVSDKTTQHKVLKYYLPWQWNWKWSIHFTFKLVNILKWFINRMGKCLLTSLRDSWNQTGSYTFPYLPAK